jgi:putative addiction module component (TIGR02574 family)
MAAPAVSELLKLDVEERLRVIRVLWNSIVDEHDELPVSDAERIELDRRLAAHADDPDGGRSWDEVKADLRSR